MTAVAMYFPRVYRTSYDILLEFLCFMHSLVEQISQHERFWFAKSLLKTNCWKELPPAAHSLRQGKG